MGRSKKQVSIDSALATMSGPPRHADFDEGVKGSSGASNHGGDGQDSIISGLTLSPDGIRTVRALVDETIRAKLLKEGLADAIKGAAAKLGVKPGEVSEMINIVIKEQEKGGVIEEKERRLEFARSVLFALVEYPALPFLPGVHP
jgi:hypothetical protein